eukprot:gene28431-biopygen24390
MKPFTAALHRVAAKYEGNHHAHPRRLPQDARCDIIMWRGYLCLLLLQPANFARSLESLLRPCPTVIEYNASLALGVEPSVLSPRTGRFRLKGYAHLVLPFMTDKDSSFQNTNEYAAVLLGLALIS